jgi:hypothetical protein
MYLIVSTYNIDSGIIRNTNLKSYPAVKQLFFVIFPIN